MSNGGFYEPVPDANLRFGDVLLGVPALEHVTEQLNPDPAEGDFSIRVRRTAFSVVMSPCCSIEEGIVSLAPLTQIDQKLLSNPFLVEDFTRVNHRMTAEQAAPPQQWVRMPEEERARRELAGMAYAFVEYFVYAPAEQLPAYVMAGRDRVQHTVRHYMVDFRDIYKVHCREVQRNRDIPSAPKVLQLSVLTRRDLRDKLGEYYWRPPDEDRVLLEG
ncbi:hypothetical protein LLH23_19000 [bacterium]|nr:hypothetical protein [bacterium]